MNAPTPVNAPTTARARRSPFAGRSSLVSSGPLLVVLAAALALRLYGVGWDGGKYAHPDELHIAQVTIDRISWPDELSELGSPGSSPMNPRRLAPDGTHLSYSYGTLLVYALKGASNLAATATGEPALAGWERIYAVGRTLAALADTVTVLAVYGIGALLWNRRVGLFAAACSALAVLQIQHAHFYVAEPVMTMLLALALLQVIRALRLRTARSALLAGVLLGLAVGAKPSAAAFLPSGLGILLLAQLMGERRKAKGERRKESSADAPHSSRGALSPFPFPLSPVVAGLGALAAWALCEPYAVLDFGTYAANIRAESMIQTGEVDYPYTRQYIGTAPGWYHLSQFVRWSVGLPLGLAVIAGLCWAVIRSARRRDWRPLLLLAWIAPYLVAILRLEAKWSRYMLPVTPVLLLLASAALWAWRDEAEGKGERRKAKGSPARPLSLVPCPFGLSPFSPRHLPLVAMTAVLLGTAAWALAFERVYSRPHPWVQASAWIYEHVPEGAVIGREHWDTPLPLPLGDRYGGEFPPVQIDLGDGEEPVESVAMYDDLPPEEKLRQIEQVLEQSDYLALASNRLSASIPRSPWRYAVATRYYELLFEERLGFRKVAEFRTAPGFGRVQIDERSADESFSVYDHPSPVIFKKERDLAAWELEALFADALEAPWSPTRHGSVERSLLLPPGRSPEQTGLPYFGGAATSGAAAVARWLAALTLLSLAAWLLLRPLLRGLPDRGWTVSKVLGALLVSWLAWLSGAVGLLPGGRWSALLWGGALLGAGCVAALRRPDELRADVRAGWRTMAAFELLFLGLFGAGALLRAANPDLWQPYFGGEKPMELAFINGVLRSSELPPYDPWFAGGYINYYYFGQWLVAILMRLANVGPGYGFALAVATVFAWTGTLAACIGYSLARVWGRRAGASVGALSLLFVLLIGNLDGAVQLARIANGTQESGFDFWRSARLPPNFEFINEFPFFTFLYGDLHAHMISMPLGLSLLLIAVSLVAHGGEVRARSVYLLSLLGGLLAGAVAITNPWDTPGYAGLYVLALGVYWLCAGGSRRASAVGFATTGVTLATAAALGYLPFFRSFKSFYGDVGIVRDPTRFSWYADMLGLFLFIAAWYVLTRLWRTGRLGRVLLAVASLAFLLTLRGSTGAGKAATPDALSGLPGVPSTFVSAPRGVLVLLLGLLVLLLYALWLDRRSAAALLSVGLTAGGVLIWAGIEVLYLKDFNEGSPYYRMNTVFKFGLQSWILLGLGCAGLLYLTIRNARPGLSRILPAGVLAVLLAASLIYPVAGTVHRMSFRFAEPPPGLTLDGEAYMRTATLPNVSGEEEQYAYDHDAILWMRRNIPRPATIIEAAIGPYRGNGSRVSMFTGLPAVVGWDNHEGQQRYPEPVAERNAQVRELYDSPDPRRALEIVSRYGVRYIYVGPVERLHEYEPASERESPIRYASPEGLEKFERMVGTGHLRVAYRNPGVTLYEVPPSWRWPSEPTARSRGPHAALPASSPDGTAPGSAGG